MASEPGASINAEDYLAAARSHAASLSDIYAAGHYATTIYLAGVAVECMFRAYSTRRGVPFRSDHVLVAHAAEAKFLRVLPQRHQSVAGAALTRIAAIWRNNHRYRSEKTMRRFLKGRKADRGIKGDFLKEQARRISADANDLVTLGSRRWPPTS